MTALLFVKDDILVVGQVLGFIDLISFANNRATITHSLQIKEAGDINSFC